MIRVHNWLSEKLDFPYFTALLLTVIYGLVSLVVLLAYGVSIGAKIAMDTFNGSPF